MRSPIRTRLLVSFLAIAVAAAGGLSVYFLGELEDYALRNLEARLDAEAQLIAALLATTYTETGVPSAASLESEELQALDAALDEVGPQVTTRLRVLDAAGVAIADSSGTNGIEYGDRPEVLAALAGEYGAYTRVLEDNRVALYVARPIVADGGIVGAVYSSSTTFSITTLVRDYRLQLVFVVLAFIAATVLVTELLSRWLSAPLRDLERAAHEIAAGDHSIRVAPTGSRETHAVAEAFNLMSSEVEQVVTELREEETRKARFVSDVSHELRTPLTSIRGAAETLLASDVPPDDARRFLRTIADESERLGRLASDLLVLQRMEGATGELHFGPVDLAEVTRRAIAGLGPLLSDREVRVTTSGTAPLVLGDPDRLQQVVSNLVDNASRVTPAGGTVSVALGGSREWATVDVADEGPGIPAGEVEKLFDRFYRTQKSRDRASGGAGLGLAIVKAIVEAHQGEVAAANEPGGGARLSVRLPAAD